MNRMTTFEQELERTGHLVFTNVGVSMMPLLRQGRDLMVIEKRGTARLRKYDAVLFKRDNGQYVLHRIIAVRDKDYLIMGDNTFQKEYVDDEHILGILTQVVRGRHTISVDNKHYQRFVCLWWIWYPLRWLFHRAMCLAARCRRLLRTKRP